jgi:hypothetical protein
MPKSRRFSQKYPNYLYNSDIDFSKYTVPFSIQDEQKLTYDFTHSPELYQFMINNIYNSSSNVLSENTVTLPENFSWGTITSDDPPSMVEKKKLISRPIQQFSCGNCWAMSVCQMLSDKFVVNGLVDWSPNISTTFAMEYYPQSQCMGGNSARLLKNISEGIGVASTHCVDFSWCAKNAKCDHNKIDSVYVRNKTILMPTNKGCYYDVKHYLFKVDRRPRVLAERGTVTTDEGVFRNQTILKEEILTHGPVVGGLMLLKNFNQAFTKVNGGVYLENVTNYGSGRPVTFGKHPEWNGNHAVSIMGWGLAKGIKVSNDDIADVPYWVCRNTRGPNWGENGYFKIAMYPYNKICQFLKQAILEDESGPITNSGVVICSVSKRPQLEKLRTIPSSEIPKLLCNTTDYYSKNENEVLNKEDVPYNNPPNDDGGQNYYTFIALLVAAVVVVLIMY